MPRPAATIPADDRLRDARNRLGVRWGSGRGTELTASPAPAAPSCAARLDNVLDSWPDAWLHLPVTSDVTVLLIGGRSGVGKTSVAAEASELLQTAGVAHCLIDGDNLDAAYPKAADDPDGSALTETNLRALWAGYAAIGHTRAIYVNTVSVLEAAMVVRAMGGGTAASVLLTADDDTTAARLGRREIGSALDTHVRRSTAMADHLQREATADVVRVPTDGRGVEDIALEVLHACGWLEATNPPITA